ncbi:MAG: LysM peptidoglycan-binding domain-containing protein [Gammaproteobacteria bacterium]|nr:LysM peptidoglycan-binding domain-containing protein [Gammaproteobacteria bacterium]
MEVEFTWVAHPKVMFRITAAAPAARWSEYAATLRKAAAVRTLRPSERGSIRAQRLAVATPRPGENLTALSKRTGNRWSAEETALANNLDADHSLRAGQAIKIVVDAEVVDAGER